MRVAVIGATGALGSEIVAALAEGEVGDEFDLDAPILLATKKSAGEAFPWLEEEELPVEEYDPAELRGLDAAILAVPEAEATKMAARLRELGVPTIDVSRAHRSVAPLFFGEGQTPVAGAPLVALPSPEALAIARVLEPLASFGPVWVRATVLRAASSGGQVAIADLAESTGKLLNGQEPEVPVLGHRLAFNLVPQAGAFTGADAQAELDLAAELGRLLPKAVRVSSTVAWGPWFYGQFMTLSIGFARPADPEALRAVLAVALGVKVLDTPGEAIYPMPALVTGDEAVLVGRLRADAAEPGSVSLVVAADNVRLTALQAVAALRSVWRARRAH